MLVLTRKPTESIHIAKNVVVTLLGIYGNRVRLGIEAPTEISIQRSELLELPTAIRKTVVEAGVGAPPLLGGAVR